MSSKTLKAVLQYLNSDVTVGALLLTGPWGSGKTWFVKNTLRNLMDTQSRPLISMSLFGINNTEQFSRTFKWATIDHYRSMI